MCRIIFVFLCILLSVSTCRNGSSYDNEYAMRIYEDTLTSSQLDSAINVERLSYDIENDWIISTVLNDDKKDFLYKYIFIKQVSDSVVTVYTLCTYNDTLYIFNKRVIEQ